MNTMSYNLYPGGGECYSTSCRGCHFPSNIHLLSHRKSSSWLPSGTSTCSGPEHRNRRFVAIVLPSSSGVADVTATVTKPVDISVLIQTSALLLFMYIVANFVVPQIITGKFDKEEEDN